MVKKIIIMLIKVCKVYFHLKYDSALIEHATQTKKKTKRSVTTSRCQLQKCNYRFHESTTVILGNRIQQSMIHDCESD